MKKANREALRLALGEFRLSYDAFVTRENHLRKAMAQGSIPEPTKNDGMDWLVRLDVLEETVERVLEDER